ncbi:MAG: Gfo/Idh/MocA family oxidoreductase [Candidatus Bathyarchaeia archaeon]
MKKLRVAVVGIGFWGRNHVRVFRELPQTELVGICDINAERVSALAKELEIEGYTDSNQLLKRNDLDAVTICTWTTTHAEEATKALNAGKHVLIEKPIASTVPEAKKIVELAKRKQLHLMVGFIERFNPGVQRVKEAINEGKIGTLVSATARRVSQWPERIGDIGVVKDTAIHDIDVMRYLFGEDPVAVYAKVGNLRHKRFEDYAQIMLSFKQNRTAFIETNWLTPYKTRNLIVTGSEAIISLDYLTQKVTIETAGQTLTPRYEWQEPLKLELQHFADSILNNKEPQVTGEDGLKALIIAEAALKSTQNNKAVLLEEIV